MIQLVPFKASRWLFNSHLQTLVGELLSSPPAIIKKFRSLEVTLKDGDKLVCDYLEGSRPTVCLLSHGLTGDSRSAYLLRTAAHLNQLGCHVISMNHRNCGIGFGYASRPYNSGKGDDIGEVISYLRQKFPQARILLFGYSLSANASLRLLSEPEIFFQNQDIDQHLPDAAFIANPPINLHRVEKLLNRGFNKVYTAFFIRGLNKNLRQQIKYNLINPDKLDIKKFHFAMKIKDFDHNYTSVYSGYADADDYYTRCSTHTKLHKINVPTLVLTSDDDSFVDAKDFKNLPSSSKLQVIITRGGGHLGYISHQKTKLGTRRWLDYAAVEFTQKFIK